jgi:hypothetical protein
MSRRSVDELIVQLESLRVQESEVIQQLREARAEERNADTLAATVATSRNITVIATVGTAVFHVGDLVEITNKVRPLAARLTSVTIHDKRGVVTKVTHTRVYVTTDSGNRTWRAHKNLRLL